MFGITTVPFSIRYHSAFATRGCPRGGHCCKKGCGGGVPLTPRHDKVVKCRVETRAGEMFGDEKVGLVG